jgi:hypothetical protein
MDGVVPFALLALFFAMYSWPSLVGACLFGYLTLVRVLRWQRYNTIHRKFGSKIDCLSFEEAQHVLNLASMYEMPFIMYYSLAAGNTHRLHFHLRSLPECNIYRLV